MHYFSLVLIVIFLFSCHPKSTTDFTNNMTDLEKQFLEIDTTAGIHETILQPHPVDKWQIRVQFPTENNTPRPLVLALHWAGGGETYKEYASCLAEPGLSALDAIILTPDAEFQTWNTRYNELKISQLMGLAIKHWNVDPDKIIVTGYSNGGNGSWFFADYHAHIFDYAILIASAYQTNRKINIPLYVIHGEQDELFSAERTGRWVTDAQAMGTNIVWRTHPTLSHYEGCAYVKELQRATKWVLEN